MKKSSGSSHRTSSHKVSDMVDSNELQRMARLVDMNRQRLEEINQQIERIEVVQLEHDDTRRACQPYPVVKVDILRWELELWSQFPTTQLQS